MAKTHTARFHDGTTPRAIFIGLLSAAFFAAFTPYNDIKVGATMIAGNQFPVGALFMELVLVFVVNTVLRRIRPQSAFTTAELLTVWVLILVSSGIPSGGMMRFLIPQIVALQYRSNTANNWETNLWGATPHYLRLQDTAAVKAFYEGYPRGREHVPWDVWVAPLFAWGILAALFLVASFCVASLLRRQWVENEKFAFPLVSVPLLIAEEPEEGRTLNRRLRHPLLWTAVAITTLIHGVKGMSLLYPAIPDIPLFWNLMDFVATPPLNQLDWFPIAFYPLMIGLTFLLPLEVSFSFWFFFLFYKAEILLYAVNNWQMPAVLGAHGYKQFHALQSFGGRDGFGGLGGVDGAALPARCRRVAVARHPGGCRRHRARDDPAPRDAYRPDYFLWRHDHMAAGGGRADPVRAPVALPDDDNLGGHLVDGVSGRDALRPNRVFVRGLGCPPCTVRRDCRCPPCTRSSASSRRSF